MNAPFSIPVEVEFPQKPHAGWPTWPWLCLGFLAIIDTVWILATPLQLEGSTVVRLVELSCLASAAALVGRRLEQDPRLYALCLGGAFLLCAWPVLRLFNHLSMSTSFALADPLLASWDSAIGFHWLSYALWIDARPTLLQAMDYSYNGLTGYSCLIFLLLAAGREPADRCLELLILFLATAIACSAIGMLLPAHAAMAYYAPPPTLFEHIGPNTGLYHLEPLESLRSNPEHVLDLRAMPGLVTFPSFHTALGVVAIYCARGTPWLLGPSLIVNLLMIASTPVLGSHYGIDVIAGALVAGVAILALRKWNGRRVLEARRRPSVIGPRAAPQLE